MWSVSHSEEVELDFMLLSPGEDELEVGWPNKIQDVQ